MNTLATTEPLIIVHVNKYCSDIKTHLTLVIILLDNLLAVLRGNNSCSLLVSDSINSLW